VASSAAPSSKPNDPLIRAAAAASPGPSSPPSPASVAATQAALCDTTQSNLYCVYTVQERDNLSSIAARFGVKGNVDVTSWELLVHSNKPDIVSEEDLLQIGQKLRIPTQNGVLHTVLSSQTLVDIAVQYDVGSGDILDVPVNGIGDPNSLLIGQEIIVPNPTRFARPAPPPAPAPPAPAIAAVANATNPVRGGPTSGAGFIWPTTGRISSYFSAGHPLGIDIDLFANPNAPIGAAAAGTVRFAGGNACCSYGYYVVVDHGNGYTTLYAHFSRIVVSTGERVSQGELLGYGGRTGYATGNHLHFEVHRNGVIINPMSVLP
jgi:murein DD-endopeptidase MepM/ murein hydrolase activator NlpD